MNEFVLIPRDSLRQAPADMQPYLESLPWRHLFSGQPEMAYAKDGPWLLQLNDSTQRLNNWLQGFKAHNGEAAYLSSYSALDGVFHHLQSLLDVLLPSSDLALLRFWDSRVFARLHDSLNVEQKHKLLGPLSSWQACGHSLAVLLTPQEAGNTSPLDDMPLKLTLAQYALLRLPEPGLWLPRLAAEVRRDAYAALTQLDDEQLLFRVQDSYRHATRGLAITRLSTLVKWVKADVASASVLRTDINIDQQIRNASKPDQVAEDVLSMLSKTSEWEQ